MYKTIVIIILCVLNITLSAVFAQEFSFSAPATSTNSTPSREPALSSEYFANSTNKAYREQQTKVAAIAAQEAKAEELNKIKADQAAALTPKTTQKPGTALEPPTKEQQKTMNQENPSGAIPTPVETPPSQPSPPPAQPYTGFQSSPPSSGGSNSRSTPSNNNQNSSGWGSSIKY